MIVVTRETLNNVETLAERAQTLYAEIPNGHPLKGVAFKVSALAGQIRGEIERALQQTNGPR